MKVWALCASLCFGVAACASTARVTGDFGDYRSYRATRLAPTVEERLRASALYLRDFPTGDYREEVRGWFLLAERRYFKLAWDSLPRLRAYLDALPKGPHAEAVAERITGLESRRIFADRHDQRMLDKARAFEAQLAEAADQRRELLQQFSALTHLLGATRAFGKPMAKLDAGLLLRFSARDPAAGSCTENICRKSFTFKFAVPDDKLLVSRTLELTLEIRLEHGLVRELSLSAAELFTRVAEAVEVRAVAAGDPQAHAEALGHALDRVADALDGPLPEAACQLSVVSPVVLARRCENVHLEVVAGTEAGAADHIAIVADRP